MKETLEDLEAEVERARIELESQAAGKFQHPDERQQWINDLMAIRFGSRLLRATRGDTQLEATAAKPSAERMPDTLPKMQRAVLNAIDAIWGGVDKVPPMNDDRRLDAINEHLQNTIKSAVSKKTVKRALEALAPAKTGQ